MYTWAWNVLCIVGLHRWCPARWDVMGGRATCVCDSEKHHNRKHTGTFEEI